MFQYAALKGIAQKTGVDVCIPRHNTRKVRHLGITHRTELFDFFPIKVIFRTLSHVPTVRERFFHFDEELFACPDNVSLEGYFQSERYFKHIEEEVRKDFTFKPEILSTCEAALSTTRPIALHVRRTDYLKNHDFFALPISYYAEALGHFDDGRNVIVFSDDIPWCKGQRLFHGERFTFSEYGKMDLCLMSLCSDFIIANSTYSWWGAWLAKNKNKKVIAPGAWFSARVGSNTRDLLPEAWIKILIGDRR